MNPPSLFNIETMKINELFQQLFIIDNIYLIISFKIVGLS